MKRKNSMQKKKNVKKCIDVKRVRERDSEEDEDDKYKTMKKICII